MNNKEKIISFICRELSTKFTHKHFEVFRLVAHSLEDYSEIELMQIQDKIKTRLYKDAYLLISDNFKEAMMNTLEQKADDEFRTALKCFIYDTNIDDEHFPAVKDILSQIIEQLSTSCLQSITEEYNSLIFR